MLNFDILVIIIILFAIVNGLIRGTYRQFLSLLSILIPTIILYFISPFIMTFLNSMPICNKLINSIYAFMKMILNINLEDFAKLIILLLSYLVIYFIVKIILSQFSLSTKKMLRKKLNPTSRYIGGGIGLFNAYLLIIFTLILIKPIVNINYNRPLTKILLVIYKPLQALLGKLLFI